MVAPRSFIGAATAERIKQLRGRGFATRLATQDPDFDLVIDRNGVALDPQDDVLIVWANVQADASGRDTIDVLSQTGEIQRWESLDARPGDMFMIGSRLAQITEPVVVENGIARASFRVMSGR